MWPGPQADEEPFAPPGVPPLERKATDAGDTATVAEPQPEPPRCWRSSSKGVLDAGIVPHRTLAVLPGQAGEGTPSRRGFRRDNAGDTFLEVAQVAQLANSTKAVPDKWLIPAGSSTLRNWDSSVVVALFFTALVTPYEVALLDTEIDALFVINRIVDLVFLVDMGLQFFVMVEMQTLDGVVTLCTHRALATRYFKGWFVVDMLSILPFDLIGFATHSKDLAKMKSIRLIRLFRLLKLLRILRASRILTRWETRISISFAAQKITSCFLALMVASHWMACVWALIGKSATDAGEFSWIDYIVSDKHDMPMASHWDIYMVAAHISVTTIKATHGPVWPQNMTEYYYGWISQWLGGLIWTYTIGQFCGIFANLSPDKVRFQQNMDALNRMMEQRSLPMELRYKLRGYFLQARELHTQNTYTGLLSQMCPQLQGEVARSTNKRWLVKVWYLRDCSDDFAAQVSRHMVAHIYCPHEAVSNRVPALSIISRGLVGRLGRVLRKGAVYGEDVILQNPKLRKDVVTIALTYAEILTVEQRCFLDLVQHASAHDAAEVRWGVVRLAVIRGIVNLADSLFHNKEARDRLLDGKGLEPATSKPDASTAGASDVVAQLEKLVDWKKQGLLNDQEFADAKAKLGLGVQKKATGAGAPNASGIVEILT